MKTKLLVTGLALLALTTLASAQNNGTSQGQQNQTGKGSAWVDSNNDGICDNFDTQKTSCPRGKAQGKVSGAGQGRKQGMCPCGKGQRRGNQSNFVDIDKNGVCDFRETPVKK